MVQRQRNSSPWRRAITITRAAAIIQETQQMAASTLVRHWLTDDKTLTFRISGGRWLLLQEVKLKEIEH